MLFQYGFILVLSVLALIIPVAAIILGRLSGAAPS